MPANTNRTMTSGASTNARPERIAKVKLSRVNNLSVACSFVELMSRFFLTKAATHSATPMTNETGIAGLATRHSRQLARNKSVGTTMIRFM
ncbi:MAG TPA: hypothetical protein VHN12_15845 [Geobacteraceae bacterium]|nr:hypothetical protein [Geobacteraceae bacterium]